MGISLDSLSITSAFNSIVNFFKSQENNSKWKDLSSGSEGVFLIRMLANILSNISYRLVTARRENYLSTANLKSSVLGMALNLGYSAHRGSNQTRNIKFEPNGDYIIAPFTVIGSYNDEYDVIYVGDKNEETHMRNGLVLAGPYQLASVVSMSSLTRTITLSVDVSSEIAIGDTIAVSGTGTSSDKRYTINSFSVRQVNANDKNTYVVVNEDIPEDFISSNSNSDAWAERIGIQEFKTVIGKLKTITWNAGTNKTKPFTRFEEGISEDYILYLDGEEMPTSNIVKDLINDCYLVRTNPYSSVDVLYMNHISTNTHKYGSESTFTLKYVELADVETEDYSPSMSGYGTVLDTLTINEFVDFESNDNIKINAPIDHEVQHLIRSKFDFSRRVQQYFPNVIETAYQAVTPTYTLLTYLKDDCTTIQKEEFDKLSQVLEHERYFGTPLPDYAHPVRESINIIIQLFVTDKLKDSNDIRYDINNIMKTNYSKLLAQKFDTYALERVIEQLSYVKWARVSYDVGEWFSRGITDLGTIIKANDTYYKASKILGVSGGVKPTWNIPTNIESLSINLDGEYLTEDGTIVWKAYKRLDVESIKKHDIGTKYAIGDYVYDEQYPNYMFKCVDLIKVTGATASVDVATVEKGDFIADGEIIWVCKEYSSYYPERQANTHYGIGESCNFGSKSFEVVSYIGKTGYLSPSFEQAYYPVYSKITPNIITDFQLGANSYFQISGDYRQYYNAGDKVIAQTDRGVRKQFTVSGATLANNKTNVYTTTAIDTHSAPIASCTIIPTKGSAFVINGRHSNYYKVGDYIRAIGTRVSSGISYTVTDNYTVIAVEEDNVVNPDTGATQVRTLVYIKGMINSDVDYSTLVAAGYTLLESAYNNSFILEGDMTAFFPAGSIIRAKTDEDAEINYIIAQSVYYGNFGQTYITVNQEVADATNYTKLAPAWSGTEDGEIVWEIVDDINAIQYGWNIYNDIKYKTNILH